MNEAERERNESEVEHMKAMLNFQKTDDKCQHLQKDLKRMITKSRYVPLLTYGGGRFKLYHI